MKPGGWLRRKTPLKSGSAQLARVAIPRQRKPIRAVSLKRQAENRLRRKVIDEMTGGEHPTCWVSGCGRWADDAHELLSRARGGSIVDPDNIRPVCRDHHDWITGNPAAAEAAGYALPSPPRHKESSQ